jgi:hypothetical protein
MTYQENEDREAGERAGRRWAENKATYPELARVRKLHLPITDASGLYTGLKDAIDPEESLGHRDFCEEVLDLVLRYETASADYLEGFLDGAKEFFDEVADKP